MAEIHPNDIVLATFADVGDVEKLKTSAKNLVDALNEIYQNGAQGGGSAFGEQWYVDGENNIILGENNIVCGNNNFIIGSDNIVVGDNITMIASKKYKYGSVNIGYENFDTETGIIPYYIYSDEQADTTLKVGDKLVFSLGLTRVDSGWNDWLTIESPKKIVEILEVNTDEKYIRITTDIGISTEPPDETHTVKDYQYINTFIPLVDAYKLIAGEVPQYYVEGSHEGIVTAEVFDLVQYELHRRKSLNTSYCSKSPFSSRLICGECGGTYGAKIWDSNNKYRREIYQCNHRHGRHSGDGLGCKTPHLTADEIKGAFIRAFNSCIKNRREIIDNCITAISEIPDTSKLEKQASNLSEECAVVTELIRKCVDENAHISVDPKVYAEKYEQLADRYAKAKDKLDKTETEIANRNSRKNMIAAFLDELEKQECLITDFDTGLWNAVIESMTIYSKEHIVFKFKGGTEIKWSIV